MALVKNEIKNASTKIVKTVPVIKVDEDGNETEKNLNVVYAKRIVDSLDGFKWPNGKAPKEAIEAEKELLELEKKIGIERPKEATAAGFTLDQLAKLEAKHLNALAEMHELEDYQKNWRKEDKVKFLWECLTNQKHPEIPPAEAEGDEDDFSEYIEPEED